ncbi:DNA-binding protein WhiA [Clostridiaceae bacterium AF29-16BH]|nr:DNA-binding protein WhiA [Clostridiales bacterium AM23-16LB]RHP50490.1 DNA-binding protein WhiA [Clostridiaceae bacterium AF31-3BH]RHQ24621.1 DNA-binding protein WhiA [Clostridiaceae bacterium AF29-16BH]RHR43721.1 DNA-binding protein WhiA [Clostridiaceae bacterium AF18-31LB]RHT80615.1 DNA-binding protein WhiA [Clostridiaceae bacterium AM27-36LB]
MSFSSEVKEELSEQIASGRHCRLAETAAILSLCGKIVITENDRYCVKIQTENLAVARKYFTLLRKTFNIRAEVSVRKSREVRFYSVIVSKDPEARRLLGETCLLDEDGNVSECMSPMHHRLLRQNCCRRAFIRGAFLAVGSVSDPKKSYHFEIVCTAPEKARQLQELLASYDVDAKVVLRKRHYVVYIKEGSQIVELLGLMGAHISLMQLENVRIVKEMRNSVNRKVNCETANLNKTVSAAVRQAEDIRYIQEKIGLDKLPMDLEETARLRLEHTEASLKELGDMLSPKVGKSGVNHRLRKLSQIADDLREGKEE